MAAATNSKTTRRTRKTKPDREQPRENDPRPEEPAQAPAPAAEPAPAPRAKETETKAREKAPIKPVDLALLAARGQLWSKPCKFDHAHIRVESHLLIYVEDDENRTFAHAFQTYDAGHGPCLSLKAQKYLDDHDATPVGDPGNYRAKLMRKGYLIRPTD